MSTEYLRLTYNRSGFPVQVEIGLILTGTEDFGNGPEPATRNVQDVVSGSDIGLTTLDAINALEAAVAVDVQAVRQQAADRAAVEAAAAAARAASEAVV